MHRRSVGDRGTVPHGQVIGDGDRFAMGDEKAVIGDPRAASSCAPASRYPAVRGRSRHHNRSRGGGRRPKMPLVRAPAEFRRLAAFTGKALDRPGIDELTGALGQVRHLRVALGDVNHPDAEPPRQRCPPGTVAWLTSLRHRQQRVGQVEQGLLDEVRDEARVHAVGQHRGRHRAGAPQRQRRLPQAVVRALRRRQRRVAIAPAQGSMQASRYSAPFPWHQAIRSTLATLIDRLSRKSPGPSSCSRTAR
jgi:hypothetical protein